jgi:outer membrane protein OmpA-like peptidoglycan-associated protein
MKNFGLTCLFLFLFVNIYSQKVNKAERLYAKKAYLEAAKIFSEDDSKDKNTLEKLGNCYFFTSKMEEASKWYKLLMDSHKDETTSVYYYRYAQALYGEDNFTEANKWLKLYYSKKLLKNTNINSIPDDYNYLKNKKSEFIISNLPSNSDKSEFGGTFLNDKFVFASSNNEASNYNWNQQPYLNLYSAAVNNVGELENVTAFSKEINSKEHESNAVFTKDGNTMYFTGSNRGKLEKDKIKNLKIYRAELINNKWQNVTDLSINNAAFSTEHPALNKDETKLYFSSDRDGDSGSFDLYYVDILSNGQLGEPKNLGSTINTIHREQFPFINHDTIYFSSTGHFGLGNLDVFKSVIKQDGTFSTPVNLANGINSPLDDFGYVVNKDNSFGYFSSNRKGGVGSDDIYLFKKDKETAGFCGIVKDTITSLPLENVYVQLLEDNIVVKDVITNTDGSFCFNIDKNPENTYSFKTKKTLYKPVSVNHNSNPQLINLIKYSDEVSSDIVVRNNKTQIDHEPILFDLNSSYITATARPILDHIVSVMTKYPDIYIRCESHTDSRDTDKYNMWLSKRRAKRTAEYIISKGISANRITQDGYGETQTINGCTNNVPCSEEEHQLNRRTEFVLISNEQDLNLIQE